MSVDRPRVLIVTSLYPDAERPARGIFVQRQVEALRRCGETEVAVAAFSATGAPWKYILKAPLLAPRISDADLVHVHFGLSGIAALSAVPLRKPLVLTVHGTDCHHPLTRRVTAAIARRADAVVAVSRELAAVCAVPTMEIIPPGVDVRRFAPTERREARRRLGVPEEERFLLFPADLERPEKRAALARRLAEEVGVRLRAYRDTPAEEVPLWINAADAVVVTSSREGYGLACMEALACDVPVMSTPVGVAREVLGRVPGTLCAPFDLARWAAHLRTLLADPDPRVPGRAVAEEQSTDVMAHRTAALYREVLRRATHAEA